MNQSKTTQTKKKSASRSASKPSAIKNSTARKAPPAAPNVAPEPEVVAAIVTEDDVQAMPVQPIPDASTTPSDANDEVNNESIAYEAETDLSVELAAEIATEQEEIELPTSTPLLEETATPFESNDISTSESANEDAAAEDAVDTEFLVQSDMPDEIVEPTAAAEDGVNFVPRTDIKIESEVGINPPIPKAKGIDRQLRSVSPRYAAACAEVGRLRKIFLCTLDRKSAILGVERIGESVPVKNPQINAINAEIREARQKLDELMARKKQLKGTSPELDEINKTIRELSQQRKASRLIKQAAFEDAIKATTIEG